MFFLIILYLGVLTGHVSCLGDTSFEFSEEIYNGIPGSIYCGINANAENTLNYCCWFISRNRAYKSLGGKCKAIFE